MTVQNVAAFLILWLVSATIAAPFIGRFIRTGAREMPPLPDEEARDDRPA